MSDFRRLALSLCLIATGSAADSAAKITAAEFDRQAFAALPVEEAYAFRKAIVEDGWQVRRDPSATARPDEMTIPASGWSIVVKTNSSRPLQTAAADLREYLSAAMKTELSLSPAATLTNWQQRTGVIIAGARKDMPECGSALTGTKDYQILVTPQRIAVCGYDELGAMYGLYNIEGRLDLREGPFLAANLNTVRRSLYKARMTLSGLGWMEWPDKCLASLPRYGFDSIFASVYANPDGTEVPAYLSDIPIGGSQHFVRQDPARVRDLINRAARYGIRLYCPLMYVYTGTPENEAALRKLVRNTIKQFPEIRGYVLLTEGFYYKSWFGAGGEGKTDLRDWVKQWVKAVTVVAEEAHKIDPAIEILPWDYNVDFRPDQVAIKKFVIDQLPKDTIPLVTFENGKSFTFDGETGYCRDYAISQVGPSEVASAQIAEAKKRKLPAVYANADTWSSQQFGTFPHLPFPQQWYERYRSLEEHGVDGVMESWTPGFKPNFISELRNWYSWTDAPPLDDLLHRVARRDFGSGSEDLVVNAWKQFSAAVRLNPDTGPTAGGNNAVANPLLFEQPKEHILTFEHSFIDSKFWQRATGVNPYWPYVTGYLFYPDFTNKVNTAESYAKPFSLKVFEKYVLAAADGMEEGMFAYRYAALNAPPSKKQGALREVLLAEQVQRMLRSNEAMVEFEDLRFRLMTGKNDSEASAILDRLTEILKDEIPRTEASLETARRDSRLGYEWEQDYIYWPEVLEKKLQLLKTALNEQIPAYRSRLIK